MGSLQPYSAHNREMLRRIDHYGILPLEVLDRLPRPCLSMKGGGQVVAELRDFRPLPYVANPPSKGVKSADGLGTKIYRVVLTVPGPILTQDIGVRMDRESKMMKRGVGGGGAGGGKASGAKSPGRKTTKAHRAAAQSQQLELDEALRIEQEMLRQAYPTHVITRDASCHIRLPIFKAGSKEENRIASGYV